MKQIYVERNGSKQVTWVEDHSKLKPGNKISFKDSVKEFWTILEVYHFNMDKECIPRSWHVGGL